MKTKMKWIGISGSWRKSTAELVADVKREVAAVIENGDGIVTGGSLGVDFIATEIALNANATERLRVILPTSLATYERHFRKRAGEEVITPEQAESLVSLLSRVKAAGALIETPQQTVVNVETYYLRDLEVVKASDELLAFQVNGSLGTQDTIDKARAKGIPVKVFKYEL